MTLPASFTRIFAQSSVPLSLADPNLPDSPIVLVNHPFCLLTGYEKSEIVGRNCRFLQGDKQTQPGRNEIREALDQGVDTQALLDNFTRKGEMFQNLLFIHHIRESDGKLLYLLGSQFKVTEEDTVSNLDQHVLTLQGSLSELTGKSNKIRLTTRRQITGSLRNILTASVLNENLKDSGRR